MSYARTPVPDRFWLKVDKGAPDECWEWIAARRSNNYGAFGIPGVGAVDAHRVSYALAHDLDVTAMPFVVRHTCDNPPCVNPAHLVPGTRQDNVDDMWDRERAHFPFATHCQRGHDLGALGIYTDRKTGKRRCAQCHRDRQNAWEAKRRGIVSRVDMGDYIDVAARIVEFRTQYPDGSLQPARIDVPYTIETIDGQTYIVVVAAAYRAPDDQRPGIGMAYEVFPGKTNFTRGSELQNAETSAWGRAIVAALASDTKKGVASAEEVRNRKAEQENPLPPDPLVAAKNHVWELAQRKGMDMAALQADFATWSQGETELSNATVEQLGQYAKTIEPTTKVRRSA